MAKGAFIRGFQKHVVNPVAKPFAGRAFGVALLETIGRKSGEPRQNPVTEGMRGDTFWIIAEHGKKAGYVRNIEANPRVRIRTHGRWRTGTGHVLWDDDPLARQKAEGLKGLNSWMVRRVGTDLVTVRVDLDPE
jgi:deazaflavin-dependent oxidoreductase (nitroreductase family)